MAPTHRIKHTVRTAAGAAALLLLFLWLLWLLWPRPVRPPYDLLVQFGLAPNHYRHVPGHLPIPLRYGADDTLSFSTEYQRFFDTVMAPGDRAPVWFERRGGGLFVIVQKADGRLVGTTIEAVGGRLRLAVCRTAEGGLCGFNLRRVGATWLMQSPTQLPAP